MKNKINIEFKRESDKTRRFHLRFDSWYDLGNFMEKLNQADQNNEVLNCRLWEDKNSE